MKTDNNELYDFFKKFDYYSRELESNHNNAKEFIDKAKKSGVEAYEAGVVDKYKDNPFMIEDLLLNDIKRINNLKFDVNYSSLYLKTMHSEVYFLDSANILADELLIHTMISFFIIVFSVNYNVYNLDNATKAMELLLNKQGAKHSISQLLTDYVSELSLRFSTDASHYTMDFFWCALAFIMAHELYHITEGVEKRGYSVEIAADTYGYKTLINLINNNFDHLDLNCIDVYSDKYYLAPTMLFEYYELQDWYNKAFYCQVREYHDYPSPLERKQNILSLFDEVIPDSMNTHIGNQLYSGFLDSIELIKGKLIHNKV